MFTLCFIVCLLASLFMQGYLSLRQSRHVARHRSQVPPVFAGHISLHSHQRAADYTRAKLQLGLLETCVGAALLLALTLLGGVQWLDIHLARWIGPDHELLRQMALVGAVVLLGSVVNLPFVLWRRFRLEARFGFNRMTRALFAADLCKGLLISLLLGTPLLALVLWVMDHAGAGWAWWAWGIWVSFNLLVLWLFPTVIAPIFNRFTPLQDAALAARVRSLAQRCGFGLSGVFVMDGSKRSAHGNAYFTGLGKARRIVFFDTLLERLNADEIEAVLAHELGHFKHRHILKRIVLSLLLSWVFLQGLAWLAQQSWFYADLGVIPQLGRSNSGLALILFFLVVPVFTFWVTPLAAWSSRRDEFQADHYGCSGAGVGAGQAVRRQRRHADPGSAVLGLPRQPPARPRAHCPFAASAQPARQCRLDNSAPARTGRFGALNTRSRGRKKRFNQRPDYRRPRQALQCGMRGWPSAALLPARQEKHRRGGRHGGHPVAGR